MSAQAPAISGLRRGWDLWRSQGLTIFFTELRKNFVTKRGFWIYLLALAPAAIVTMHSIVTMRVGARIGHTLAKDTEVLANIFQIFFLRPAVFFGCVGIFTYLFRGEVLEKSLHYYFLAPVRRSVLVLGKYAAGVVTAAFFFCASIALTFAGMYLHFTSYERQQYLQTAGYGHLAAYLSITALACIAYGAVFLFAGIRWRNPIVPSVALLLWESANLFMPSWLRKVSVLYYLRSMTPVDVPLKGPAALFGAVADPVPGCVALLCLAAITGMFLLAAIKELERTQISYSVD